jgi:hypothetical protein
MTAEMNRTMSVGRRARGAAAADEKNLIGVTARESNRLPLHRDPWSPSLAPTPRSRSVTQTSPS